MRGSDGGPRRFTAVVPTPHDYSGQWPVKTKRARARNCASVVTRKRPSLNRADGPSQPNPYLEVGHDWHREMGVCNSDVSRRGGAGVKDAARRGAG